MLWKYHGKYRGKTAENTMGNPRISYAKRSVYNTKWQKGIDKIAKDFNLNAEQECAYRIVANHSCNPNTNNSKWTLLEWPGQEKHRC